MTQSRTLKIYELYQDVSKAKTVEESLRMKIINSLWGEIELTEEERDLLIKQMEDHFYPKTLNLVPNPDVDLEQFKKEYEKLGSKAVVTFTFPDVVIYSDTPNGEIKKNDE